tara:strand:+ start:239 stop:391 length:153 start_codon:yes stop_codon:yes gene_type:complete
LVDQCLTLAWHMVLSSSSFFFFFLQATLNFEILRRRLVKFVGVKWTHKTI